MEVKKILVNFPLYEARNAEHYELYSDVFESVPQELAEKYHKSNAQIILRWHTQMGFAVIPGSKNIDHIRDNLNILDFRLTDEEMAEIAKLDKGVRYYTRTDEALAGFAAFQPAYEKA